MRLAVVVNRLSLDRYHGAIIRIKCHDAVDSDSLLDSFRGGSVSGLGLPLGGAAD